MSLNRLLGKTVHLDLNYLRSKSMLLFIQSHQKWIFSSFVFVGTFLLVKFYQPLVNSKINAIQKPTLPSPPSKRAMNMTEFRRLFTYQEISYPWKTEAAKTLPLKGRVFCWIMTHPNVHATRVIAINETWLPECDHGEIFTSQKIEDQSIPATGAFQGFSDTRDDLFWKTIYGFYFAFKRVSTNFDWYMKADDDAYVFMDNLHAYLSQLDPSKPYYLGYRWKGFIDHGYNSGGVYVLSKAAVILFIEKLLMNDMTCAYNQFEDVGIGACLNHIGIYPHNTTDVQGKERFLVYDPLRVYHGGLADNDIKLKGFDAFSPETISFHHMEPSNMIFTHIIRRYIKYPLPMPMPMHGPLMYNHGKN